jgi:hypothetical protein
MGDDFGLLPLPALLVWVAARQTILTIRRQPRWAVVITQVWEPDSARAVVLASRAHAFARVDSEAAASLRVQTDPTDHAAGRQ